MNILPTKLVKFFLKKYPKFCLITLLKSAGLINYFFEQVMALFMILKLVPLDSQLKKLPYNLQKDLKLCKFMLIDTNYRFYWAKSSRLSLRCFAINIYYLARFLLIFFLSCKTFANSWRNLNFSVQNYLL